MGGITPVVSAAEWALSYHGAGHRVVEEYARVSLAFYGPRRILEQLLAFGGVLSVRGNWSRFWNLEPDATPDVVIEQATQFLESNVDELVEVAGSCTVAFTVSWTPHEFQDSLALGPTLVASLAKLSATILVDTYTSRSSDDVD